MTHSRASTIRALTLVGVVTAACVGLRMFGPVAGAGSEWFSVDEGVFKILAWVAPILIGLRIWSSSWQGVLAELRLTRGFAAGVLFGLAATLPMLLGLLTWASPWIAAGYGPSHWLRLSAGSVLGTAVLGPFAEEVLFRGLLVGQLISRAHWRPLPAILIGAVAFGLAHVGNGLEIDQVASVVFGGAVFGWLFVKWDSLWPSIGLHAAINFYWDVGSTPAGQWHGVALMLAIVITLARDRVALRRRGGAGGLEGLRA